MEKDTVKGLWMLVFAILIAGCASGLIGSLPIADEKLSGEVVVIRISSVVGVTNSYIITLNGADIFGIRSGQHMKFKVNEGEYYLGIKCFGGWSPTWKEDSLKFSVAPKSKSYFLVGPDASCASIKSITEKEAQEKIKESKYGGVEQ